MWDFETDPEFQKKLDWMETFVRDEIEPLDLLFHQDQTYNPGNQSLMAIMKPLKQKVRDQGLWACHLPKKLGGDGYGQVQLALMNEIALAIDGAGYGLKASVRAVRLSEWASCGGTAAR